jgi:large subunit ribosomal protein L32
MAPVAITAKGANAMGVPKYRRSRREKRNHRAHLRMSRVTVSECPRCHEPKLPHRVCTHCGYYRGMEILKVVEEED